MGRGIYNIEKCAKFNDEQFTLQEHQNFVLDYYIDKVDNDDEFKGLLLYHTLGSGKTCSEISIANKLLSEGKIEKVYVFTPGSLRSTWIEEYCKKCGKSKYSLSDFTFVTYNYDFFRNNKTDTISLTEKTLIIVDEVHNFINAVKNESNVCTKIYRMFLNCESKFILLSGTPIYNYIKEFWYIGSILKPKIFGKKIRYRYEVDSGKIDSKKKDEDENKGENIGCKDCIYNDPEKFEEMFSEENTISKEASEELKKHIKDCISFHEGDKEFLPEIIYNEPIKVEASESQLKKYLVDSEMENKLMAYKTNKKESEDMTKLLQKLKIMANKRILTRRVSNFYYNSFLYCLKDEIIDENPLNKIQGEKELSEKFFTKTDFSDIEANPLFLINYQKATKALLDSINDQRKRDELYFKISKINILETNIKEIKNLKTKLEKKTISKLNYAITIRAILDIFSNIELQLIVPFNEKGINIDWKLSFLDEEKKYKNILNNILKKNPNIFKQNEEQIQLQKKKIDNDIELEREKDYYKQLIMEEDNDDIEEEIKVKKDPYKYDPKTKMYNFGWICDEMLKDGKLLEYSPKIVALILMIYKYPQQKHVVFSFFKNKSGVKLIKNLLSKCGLKCLLFSGDETDKERKSILEKFNKVENRYGAKYQVLLITEAGAEGINILEDQNVHIFESSPRYTKIKQVIGRVARYKSHFDMPVEQQKVNVWYYWTVWPESTQSIVIPIMVRDQDGKMVPKEEQFKKTEMIDEILYKKAKIQEKNINAFLEILKESSIEKQD